MFGTLRAVAPKRIEIRSFSHSNWQVTRAGASQATTSTSTSISTSASIHDPIATQTFVWNTTEVIGSILNTSRVSLHQLYFGWRVGNGAHSTKVKHVHEKRSRGERLVTLPYLTLNYLIHTSNEYIIITLDEPTCVPLSVGYIHRMLAICTQKRRSPEVRLVRGTFLGPFFIRILTLLHPGPPQLVQIVTFQASVAFVGLPN